MCLKTTHHQPQTNLSFTFHIQRRNKQTRKQNMGLNAKEISLRFCKMFLAFYNTSYTFVQKHPLFSGVFSVSFICYIFLSYIYSFLVYLSPFILVTAIFIRIFWSSEQPQLRYVKREKRSRSDCKNSRFAGKYCRSSDFVLDRYYTYSSHYNTSRRRSSRDKKWGLNGGNAEFDNACSEINTENISSLDRSRDSSSDNNAFPPKKSTSHNHDLPAKKSASPNRQTLRSEPSMSDLVHYSVIEGTKDENEGAKDNDDRIKDVVGLANSNNGKKNSLDVGFLESERKSRMENLINSKARKELKMQLDKGVNPTHHLAPMLITRNNSFRGSKRFEVDGIEMPDSAPSIIRPSRTFNFLYNSSQDQKPTFHQESTQGNQKDKTLFSRHESFSVARFRRLPDKGEGNHDKLIEQLFSKSGTHDNDESGLKSPKSQINLKEPDRNNGFAETDQNIRSSQRAELSEKPEPKVLNHMNSEKALKFPISNSTSINESLFKSLVSPNPNEKNQENMFYASRQLRKTPTDSIASDLQVEVSEVGSPTKAINGSSLSSDEESSVYDGDNEKDYSSGSEDIWGNSVHVREVHGIGNFEGTPKANMNSNNKDLLSTVPLQEIDEENSADVSSVSSTCELPGDTPTCEVSPDQNLFGSMQNEATDQPLNSLDVPSSQANSERIEEWCNLNENYTKGEDVRDLNDSATIDKDHIDSKTLHKKSIGDISVQSNLPFSPRSVLPKKNPTDEVSSLANDQQRHTQVPKPKIMEDMAKTTSSELHSHNGDRSNSQISHHADEAKSDVKAKKDDAQDKSTHLAEKEAMDLTQLAARTSTANIPTKEKVPLSEEKEVESQHKLVNQESAAEACMNAIAMDSTSTNNFEGKKHYDSKENDAVSIETKHSEEPIQVTPPKNFVMPTKQNDELPPDDVPHYMQQCSCGYLTT